ncbi:B-box zinc finger protein [Oscillospiraceae bacterium Marseille-Q3528]|nr:B-box zinc finger protein [Oscillospiraceae bacterium Marseille-Q3528]
MDNKSKTQEIPTFTPPEDGAPVFTPPRTPQHDGPVCYHHPSEPAVARCARCGKYICKDCAETYTVTAGEYANKCLCFDCCEQLVAENVAELTKNKNKIKGQFILQIIGIVIGFIFGISMGGGLAPGLVCACIGGVFLSALKLFGSLALEAVKIAFSGNFGWLTVFSVIFQIVGIILKCIKDTISNTIQYICYLKRTQGFIESDSAALQQMRDYMAYTLVRNQNKGIDLEDLMKEGSELYNNSYARAVRENGEAAADAVLRQAATRIAENGEIIRDFPGAANA